MMRMQQRGRETLIPFLLDMSENNSTTNMIDRILFCNMTTSAADR